LKTAVTKAACLEWEIHQLDASYNPAVRELMHSNETVSRDQNGKETTKIGVHGQQF
jgi:hypothetical protein